MGLAMPLSGTFDILNFTEVLQILASHGATGRLHVRHRSFAANMFLENGLLTGADQSEHQAAAASGDVVGRLEEICFEMLETERGSFEFHPGKPSTVPISERYPTEHILKQARKRLDDWRRLQEIVPSMELQAKLVSELSKAEITLDKECWRVLTAIDGRRNLRIIGRLLNLSDYDICRTVASLLDEGVVELEGLAALALGRDATATVPPPDTTQWVNPAVVVTPISEPVPTASVAAAAEAGEAQNEHGDGTASGDDPRNRRSRLVRIRGRETHQSQH